MRIPIKTTINGYTPAYDSNSKNKGKLVWYKSTKNDDLPYSYELIFTTLSIPTLIAIRWAFRASEKYPKSINISRDLGSPLIIITMMFLSFVVSIIWYYKSLHVRDNQKLKRIPQKQSIELYYKAPMYSELRRRQVKNRWWLIPLYLTLPFLFHYLMFTTWYNTRNFKTTTSEGFGLVVGLFLIVICVYQFLYSLTTYLARRYVERELNIDTKSKKYIK